MSVIQDNDAGLVLPNCLLTASDPMKLRSFFSFLIVVVSILLVLSASGFYWLVAHNPLQLLKSGQDAIPGAAIFVPKQAPVMTSLLLNPEQLETFRLIAAPPAERRQARAELNQLKQNLLATTGLDYERDIQPWLGQEVTLAVTTLDIDHDVSNGQQPGYLAAIATQDPERSREFLQLFWQKRAIAGADLVFEQYKGVKIISANTPAPEPDRQPPAPKPKPPKYRAQLQPPQAPIAPPPRPTLASAAVGDQFILFANHPKVLRDAITNVQAPDLSLSNSSAFTEAIETLTQPHIGLTLVDLPKLTRLLNREQAMQAETPNGAIAVPSDDLATPQTLVVGFNLNQKGLLAETALLTTDSKAVAVAPSLSQPVGALQYIPANSALAASGNHLDRLWDQVDQNLARYTPVTQLVNQPLRELQSRWELSLPDDIFHWVTGEYALALLPADTVSADGSLKTDWIFAAQRSSLEANEALAHLDDLAKQQGLTIGPLKLGDRTVSTWTRLTAASPQLASQTLNLQAEVQGVHASVGNYEIFATSIAAMDKALKATGHSLPTRDRFKEATNALIQPNNGYLYLDWDASQSLLERQFPLLKVIELAGKPFFSHLRSLTISSYGNNAGVQRGGAFIQLGR